MDCTKAKELLLIFKKSGRAGISGRWPVDDLTACSPQVGGFQEMLAKSSHLSSGPLLKSTYLLAMTKQGWFLPLFPRQISHKDLNSQNPNQKPGAKDTQKCDFQAFSSCTVGKNKAGYGNRSKIPIDNPHEEAFLFSLCKFYFGNEKYYVNKLIYVGAVNKK